VDPREEILNAIRELRRLGILHGREGNLSVRVSEDLLIITPTQKDYGTLSAEDLVTVDMHGRVVGEGSPSSELQLHLEIYRRRPDVKATIHAHPIYASVLAVTHSKLPVIMDEVAIRLGGEIEVSKYAPPGTGELAKNAAEVLGKKGATLLANHGCVAVGRSMEEALSNIILLENASKVYVLSKAFGSPRVVPREKLEGGALGSPEDP